MISSVFQQNFTYVAAPQRIVFESQAHLRVGEEVAALGRKRCLVLTTPEQAATGTNLVSVLGQAAVEHFDGATMHTPVDITEKAVLLAQRVDADCLVAIGGGSTIGLSKAIALRTALPQVVIPTSFAGSEATPILGQTEANRKTTLTDGRIRPDVVLYDVTLVRSLPPHLVISSGMNALAHAIEGLYARDRNPIASLMAIEGIRAIRSALLRLRQGEADDAAWSEALYGAWLCGSVLGQVGMALHHKLCHALGGGFNLPHAETHAVMLPHAVAYNEVVIPDLLQPVAAIFGTDTAHAGLTAFASQISAPTSLAELGFTVGDLPNAVKLATANPYWNPRPVERSGIEAILSRALNGEPAQS
ncbi:maleylacetate reductase [Acidiphilium sp. PM]|uniref:maleylacetate reductase n=1 Tax=Acidiphilium sp. PM TaxID=1043206 RepID=UPI00021454BB|nr:maleylacetate reductase [Acidiphilium sp. PM]EGO96662.1 Putative maleylacetate reductase [Acidiphilium sp. PM]